MTSRQLGPQHLRTIVLAGMVGNLMEWYHFGLYGVFAPLIERHFFPSEDPVASLLATFAVFASSSRGARPSLQGRPLSAAKVRLDYAT